MADNKKNAVVKAQKKDIVETVQAKVKKLEGNKEIVLPKNYSSENALKSAFLILQETKDRNKVPALQCCTKDSIANSLLDMVIQGLSPAKKQCYFVVYGDQLNLLPSYFGAMAVTKRLSEVKDVKFQVIYQKDDVEIGIENGEKTIKNHIQKLENINTREIAGAYVIIEKSDGSVFTEIMNINQIKQAWQQGKFSEKQNPIDKDGNIKEDTVHYKFTDQMVLKTVISRACKTFANTSDDSDLLIQSFNRTMENEYKNKEEKETPGANQETIDIEDSNVVDAEYKEVNPKEDKSEDTEKKEGCGF